MGVCVCVLITRVVLVVCYCCVDEIDIKKQFGLFKIVTSSVTAYVDETSHLH